jgi:DNA replication protein DnaC
MTFYETPTDWKSDKWWRNRPVEERLYHLRLPKRIEAGLPGPRGQEVTVPLFNDIPDGILITGPAKTGKSLKAASLLQSFVSRHGMSGRWVEANDYVDMIKEGFGNDGMLPEMYSSPHLVKYIRGVFDVIVLDGLGEEYKTEFASHELASLVRKRYDNMKPTIITTPLSLAELQDKYHERLHGILESFHLIETATTRRSFVRRDRGEG